MKKCKEAYVGRSEFVSETNGSEDGSQCKFIAYCLNVLPTVISYTTFIYTGIFSIYKCNYLIKNTVGSTVDLM